MNDIAAELYRRLFIKKPNNSITEPVTTEEYDKAYEALMDRNEFPHSCKEFDVPNILFAGHWITPSG